MTHDRKLLVRALLSGVLSYAGGQLVKAALRPFGASLELEGLLPGLLFGLLVMAPAAPAGPRWAWRRAAAVLASVLIYNGAVKLAVHEIVKWNWRDPAACALSGLLGAVLIGLAARFILPRDISPRQLRRAAAAGALTGAIFGAKALLPRPFADAFEVCTLVMGFVAWQSSMAFILFRGTPEGGRS